MNVQLMDVRADTHLWAKSYDRDFRDVLGVESEVSQEIAEVFQAIFRQANPMFWPQSGRLTLKLTICF